MKSTLIATAFIRIPAVACLTRIPLVMLSNMGSLAHATYRVATEDFLDPCDPFSDGGFAIRIEIMCSMSVLGFAVPHGHETGAGGKIMRRLRALVAKEAVPFGLLRVFRPDFVASEVHEQHHPAEG